MKKLLILLSLILSTSICNAQDAETAFQFRTNQETERRLLRIEGGVSLTSGVTGILPLANGGTGALLVDPDADRIGFWDDSEGTFDWLIIGSGLGITSTTLLNTHPIDIEAQTQATWTTSDNSGDISLVANKRYLIFIVINAVSTDQTLYLRFNSDSTEVYAWNIEEVAYSTTPSEVLTGDNSDNEIELGGVDGATNRYWFNFTLDNTRTNGVIFISGTSGGSDDGSGFVGRTHHGIYTGGAPTSFEIVSSTGTTSGTVDYYQLN